MSNVNFNPSLPPPSEPEDDSKREERVDDHAGPLWIMCSGKMARMKHKWWQFM